MSAFANPILVGAEFETNTLERISFNSSDQNFSERWLQEALFAAPQSLPVSEIDPHIGPLIPLCMELGTDAGPADILFVTPTGQLVLVETKLWRNPEARRAVVAQILDYAKQLTLWSFDDLARAVAMAAKADAGYLLKRVMNVVTELDEITFVDGINRSLKQGDFLLLIVGDGIRSDAESLVGFLERYGNLRFGLALIEVAAYRLPNKETLLLPRILAKTEIIQRTILMGPSGPVEFEQLANSEDNAGAPSQDNQWFNSFWTEFLSGFEIEDKTQPLPKSIPKSTNLFLQLPPGGAYAWISIFLARASSRAGVYLTFAKSLATRDDYFDRLLSDRDLIETEIGIPLVWQKQGDKKYISSPDVPVGNLDDPMHRQQVIQQLRQFANAFVGTFRHRLAAFSKESN
ncbi:DUF4268 domain-containing protein [Azonexus sp. IMCC34839]|uniref:DUF4268 domain-containing protein n=1 Tax=Azonexus sp. IMCC34839 TaxID=3133695 RepID=UPI0039994BC5